MDIYKFTTDRGNVHYIHAWFKEQAIKDFVIIYQPEIFVRVEKLEHHGQY